MLNAAMILILGTMSLIIRHQLPGVVTSIWNRTLLKHFAPPSIDRKDN